MKAELDVSELPILMCAEMVRHTLSGRKTKTRRIQALTAKTVHTAAQRKIGFEFNAELARPSWFLGTPRLVVPERHPDDTHIPWSDCGCAILYCPYGRKGDRLWVKETFAVDVPGCELQGGLSYRADHVDPAGDGPARPMLWKPSIFMARRQSRISLEIVSVDIQRLQEITEADARAEGCAGGNGSIPGYRFSATPLEHFQHVWKELNAARGFGWDVNPWVWVIEFKRITSAT